MKTVFIIGAGASKEIGMPVGIELRNSITEILSTIKYSFSVIDQSSYLNFPEHIQTAREGILEFYNYEVENIAKIINDLDEIIQSLEFTSSIDNLLYDFRSSSVVQTIGKIAIISAILKAERDSALLNLSEYPDLKPTMEGTWYYLLFSELNKKASLSTFIERLKSIYFIIFNYDRTLEYYLYNSIMRFYKTNTKETTEIINQMNIYHPYGQAGFLPFQSEININHFGNVKIDRINIFFPLIKTFMLDNINMDEEHKKACHFLYSAEKVFFLGFAFYSQNIDLLFPKIITRGLRFPKEHKEYIYTSNYYGTFYQISPINQNEIIKMVRKKNERISEFITCKNKCVDFFNEFSSIISFC